MQSIPIKVSALWDNRIYDDVEKMNPTHVFSFLDPGYEVRFDDCVSHHTTFFNDLTSPFAVPLTIFQIEHTLRSFEEMLSSTPEPRVILHCHLGVSRSPAFTYILFAMLLGRGKEDKAFSSLLKITNKPWPNHGVVALVDNICGHHGRLLFQLEQYRKDHPVRHRAYRKFNQTHKRKEKLALSNFRARL